jgi:site-specific DNA recombinase
MKCFTYLRTSGDDGKEKAGLPVQREACVAFAEKNDYQIVAEYPDDGVTGKLPMHARPQGKLMISALLADGIKIVLCYDAKRIGRTQPAFWSFIGLCRDSGITVLDASGTDLCGSVLGGVNGLLSEMDRDATVARLQAGKVYWRGRGKRVEGRDPYGSHPLREYDGERAVVTRIQALKVAGASCYGIAKALNADGIKTRYGCQFTTTAISNILRRTA